MFIILCPAPVVQPPWNWKVYYTKAATALHYMAAGFWHVVLFQKNYEAILARKKPYTFSALPGFRHHSIY
jgi:hypothetical protein